MVSWWRLLVDARLEMYQKRNNCRSQFKSKIEETNSFEARRKMGKEGDVDHSEVPLT